MSNPNPKPPVNRQKAGRQRHLCPRCEKGDHSGEHNKGVGCIEVVDGATGLDFVCNCAEEVRSVRRKRLRA